MLSFFYLLPVGRQEWLEMAAGRDRGHGSHLGCSIAAVLDRILFVF
jgi:hypothetical protein